MFTLTTLQPVLKVLYPQGLERILYENAPLYALMPKRTDLGGEYTKLPTMFGNTPLRSASDTYLFNASVTGQSSITAFQLTPGYNYAKGTMSGITMASSKGNKEAVISELKLTLDGMQNSLARSIAAYLYGDGLGTIGTIGAIAAGPPAVITLADVNAIVNFEVGQVLQTVHTVVGVETTRADAGTVASVDRNAGTVTLTGAAPGGWVATDRLIMAGDVGVLPGVSAAAQAVLPKGVQAWLTTSPSATPFFNVVRPVDPTRLAGIGYAGGAAPKAESLVRAATAAFRNGAKPDKCFVNPSDFGDIEIDLGAKVQYMRGKVQGAGDAGDVGFDTIRIHGPAGVIDVVPDPNCPTGKFFMLQMNTWCHWSVGKYPDFLMEDGLKLLRQVGSDSYEIRQGGYPQVSCKAPGFNVNGTF